MRVSCFISVLIFFLAIGLFLPRAAFSQDPFVKLPEPDYEGGMSVEQALYQRQSVREFKGEPLSLKEVGQMLWAACGINVDGVSGATRTAPSAGASYSVELYLVVGHVEGLDAGIYRYLTDQHSLQLSRPGDVRDELSLACLGQRWVREAPATIVLVSMTSRATSRYGQRGMQYIYVDVGHIGQNIHLEAESLGLGTVAIGAFSEDKVAQILGLTKTIPVYLMPFGKRR